MPYGSEILAAKRYKNRYSGGNIAIGRLTGFFLKNMNKMTAGAKGELYFRSGWKFCGNYN
jgi:hypothetical protein